MLWEKLFYVLSSSLLCIALLTSCSVNINQKESVKEEPKQEQQMPQVNVEITLPTEEKEVTPPAQKQEEAKVEERVTPPKEEPKQEEPTPPVQEEQVEEEVAPPVQEEVVQEEAEWLTKEEFNYTMIQILDEWGCAYSYNEYDGVNAVEFRVSENVHIMAYLKDDGIHVKRLSIFTTGYDEDEYFLALNLFDIGISAFTDDVERVEEIKETIVGEYGFMETDNFGYEFEFNEADETIEIIITAKG